MSLGEEVLLEVIGETVHVAEVADEFFDFLVFFEADVGSTEFDDFVEVFVLLGVLVQSPCIAFLESETE